MNWMKTNMRRVTFVLFIAGLLAMSLLFAACGASTGGNTGSSVSNNGNTNITTGATQGASSSGSSSSSSTTTGNDNQQVQNAIQAIDGAQNDVNNADATATSENGSDPLP